MTGAREVFERHVEPFNAGVRVRYAWPAAPDAPAGTMWMTAADGPVSDLIVTFDPA